MALRYPIFLLRNLILVILITISTEVLAQPPVDVWSVSVPTNAMNCTSTTVTVNGWNDAGNYVLQPITHSVVNDTIFVNVKYVAPQIVIGVLTSWSHSVNLGNVPYGNYTVKARGYLDNVYLSSATHYLQIGACCSSAIPNFTLSDDTVCNGEVFTYTSSSAGNINAYSWNIANQSTSTQTSGSASISGSGTYSVTLTVSSSACTDSLVKDIEVLPLPDADLGNDTSICSGDTLMLELETGNDYLWSDATTEHFNQIWSAGSLSVTVTDANGCSNADTIAVIAVLNKVVVNLGPDVWTCTEHPAVLNAGTGGSTYHWSTGDTTQYLSTTSTGIFSVTVSESNMCDGIDQITVFHYSTIPVHIEKGLDSCEAQLIWVDSATHQVVSWNNGPTINSQWISQSGQYSVTATDINGCSSTKTVEVNVYPLPDVFIGNDTFLCGGQVIILSNLAGGNGTYLWSTGSNSSVAAISSVGTFWLQFTDVYGCIGVDTIMIDYCLSSSGIKMENVRLYPNPAAETLMIEGVKCSSFELFGMNGVIVKSGIIEQNQINVEELPDGVYFLKLISDINCLDQQLIINKQR